MYLPETKPKSAVMDLITGLAQVFTRPSTTPLIFPPDNNGLGSWGNPIERYLKDEIVDPGFYIKDKPWRDDTEQQDWLKRWDIKPANDARYLPTFPEPNDTSTGADIRRGWHNSYKDFAKNTIGQHAPMFAEQMPQPQPQQSYGDFMSEIKSVANSMADSALGGTADWNNEGGIFSGLRPNQQPSPTTPGTPPYKPQPTPAASDGEGNPVSPEPLGEGGWFKPLDQMIAEIEERQARGEIFDEKNNVWVKPPQSQPSSVQSNLSTGYLNPQTNSQGKDTVPSTKASSANNRPPQISIDPKIRDAVQNEFGLDDQQKAGQAKISSKEGTVPVPYHPGGKKSGVTIGEGYDIGQRTKDEVARDLKAAKIDQRTIDLLSATALKQGDTAKIEAERLRDSGVQLSPEQIARLTVVVGKDLTKPIDDFARRHSLTKDEYDGLVGLNYMSGKAWFDNSKTKKNIERGDFNQAVKDLEQAAAEARNQAKQDPVKAGHATRYQEMADILKKRATKQPK